MESDNERPYKQFHLRLPIDLLIWFKVIAKKNRRSITSEMILALESWRAEKSKE